MTLAETCVEPRGSDTDTDTDTNTDTREYAAPAAGARATSCATGRVLEEMEHHSGTEGKAISLGLMLGWPVKEAHLKAKEGGNFLAAVKAAREMALPSETGRGMYHVAFCGGGEVVGQGGGR